MKSFTIFAVLLLSISTTIGFGYGPKFRAGFMKTQFGFFEKFVHYKDRDALNQFISPYFQMELCDGRRMEGYDFISSVLNMPSSSPFHVEVHNVDYGNPNALRDFAYLKFNITIHGFGKPAFGRGSYIIADLDNKPTWSNFQEKPCK
ncbi:unnamed protein product [Caenorhabditis brenneri]